MSYGYNPNTVKSGLVMNYDFGNPKSYTGEPTTNQYATPTPDSNGFVNFPTQSGGQFQRIFEGTYGGYTIKPTDVVYKYASTFNACHYHGNAVPIGAGVYANFSFDFYVSPDVTGYVNNYLANFENYGGGGMSGGISDPTPTVFGQWKTINQQYGPTSSSGTQAMFLYPGNCGNQLTTTGYILFKNPQVTFTNYRLPPTGQFGTRSAVQAAIDLTGNRTTSTLNITYPPGATPLTYNFLNSTTSALITDSSSILNTDTHSIFFMIRFNTTAAYGATGYSGSWNKVFTFNPPGTDRSPGIWRYPSERRLHWRYDPGNTGCDFGKDSSSNQFDIDTWYYVGVTKDGGLARMYVNGVQIGTGSVANPKTSGTAPVYLYEDHPVGLSTMGLCQVYERVISADEVMQNFMAIRGRYGI
jgi:hypothetical protein